MSEQCCNLNESWSLVLEEFSSPVGASHDTMVSFNLCVLLVRGHRRLTGYNADTSWRGDRETVSLDEGART